ncbi:MAG: 4Fe-4S dicluster domain-containing protein [Desulfobacteraceae bacterium]|nr:4Fe-4S dicluster domain-containing protein [Desulfobacteraceae bacterium]
MTDIYQKLATHLNNLPAGYPATESGVELRILKRLFSRKEAQTALGLTMITEPASGIAKRLGKTENEIAPLLESMSKKGLIFRVSKAENTLYMAAQFIIGIWEYHLNDLDEGLIRDVNEYIPHLMEKNWLANKTKQLRVIPLSRKLTTQMQITAYEDAEEIIKKQAKIVVSSCICRKENQMIGKGCDNPLEVCFAFGTGAYYYEDNGLGRSIDQQEALEILNKGRQAGLVLQPGNAKKTANICMCCGCCCQVLKNLKTLPNPAHVVHSNHFAQVDEEKCIACEECTDFCHVDAISIEQAARIDLDRCIGCGVCIQQCPAQAIIFKQKDSDEKYDPPANTVSTYINIARERGLI